MTDKQMTIGDALGGTQSVLSELEALAGAIEFRIGFADPSPASVGNGQPAGAATPNVPPLGPQAIDIMSRSRTLMGRLQRIMSSL